MSALRSGAAAAVLLAAVVLTPATASAARGGRAAACRLQPHDLDVGIAAGPLIARIELRSEPGRPPLGAEQIEPGVYISSVDGIPLPPPGSGAEGIEEDPAGRSAEDLLDVASGAAVPNGVREAVVRFARPSDGDPHTRGDGNAGDLLAMLTDLPDGTVVEVCLAGAVGGETFRCCDAVTLHNRGLRDLPRGLFPEAAPGPR